MVELVKSLMGCLEGRVGLICSTFEESPNCFSNKDTVNFVPSNIDYSYSVDDLMVYFADKNIQNLILVNPDNIRGNYIKKADFQSLMVFLDLGLAYWHPEIQS